MDPHVEAIEKFSACQRNGHHYEPISDPYYKTTGEERCLGPIRLGMKKDKRVRYVMLCCTCCGCTKEIIHLDRRFTMEQLDKL